MNKTITFSIIAIIIILLLVFFINSNKTEAPTDITDVENGESANNDQQQGEPVTSVEDGTYTVDTQKSTITWTGRKTLVENWTDTGTIDIQSGQVTIENNEAESNELVINMESISAESTGQGGGESQLNQHLKSEDFFNVAEHPTSKFEATNVELISDGQFQVTGDLTIKDITNEITFPVEVNKLENQYRIVGETNIDRAKWNVRFGSDSFFDNLGDNVIDDQITIEFDVWAEIQN